MESLCCDSLLSQSVCCLNDILHTFTRLYLLYIDFNRLPYSMASLHTSELDISHLPTISEIRQ